MADNEELEGRQEEEAAEAASETAEQASEAGESGDESAPEGEASSEEGDTPEEAAEPEEKKSKVKEVLRKILMTILYVLLVLVILFEAGAVYLWFRYDTLVQPGEQPPARQTVTSSSYANWDGVFRPSDWPEAEAVHSGIPPELFDGEAEADSDEAAEPAEP